MRQAKENKIVFLLVFLIFLFANCGGNSNVKLERLAKVYARLIFTSQLYAGLPDSIKSRRKKIFNQFHLTEAEYFKKLKSIKADAETWNHFFDVAEKELNKMKSKKRR